MDADIKYLFIVYFLIFLVVVLAGLALILLIFANASNKKSRQMSIILDRFKVAQREIENIEKTKTNFVNSITHEIRTPINAVLGMDEMILQDCDDPKILEYAADIKRAGGFSSADVPATEAKATPAPEAQ